MQFFWGGALISCSNGSSSSDDDDESSYGTKIYSESVTFSETPEQIVSVETLADLSIKSLTIKVINVNYSGSNNWWFDVYSDSSWNNKATLEWQSGEGSSALYLATITDATAIAAYKANGIYIAGTDNATATVSVFYVEGEAEESDDSGSEKTLSNKNITFTSDRIEVVSSENFSSIEIITSVKIKVTNLSATDCWITLYATNATDDWDTGKYEMKSTDWSTTETTYEITEAETIKTYKNGGIYIQGTSGVTGTVTVSYE